MFTIPIDRPPGSYATLGQTIIRDYSGGELCSLCLTPEVLIDEAIAATRESFHALQDISVQDLLKIFKRAATIFKGEVVIGERAISLQEHIELSVRCTGMPIRYIRESMGVICFFMNNVASFLKAQSPDGSLKVYDSHLFKRGGKQLAWAPSCKCFGTVSPSNHPSVHTLWLGGLASKIPMIIRPSEDDVFTPIRILKSLHAAGFPDAAACFLPGDHKISFNLLRKLNKGIIFGSRESLDFFQCLPHIKTYGPGNSKIIIDGDFESFNSNIVDQVSRSLISYGGRGCLSASGIITTTKADKLAEAVASRIMKHVPLDPMENRATLAAVKDRNMAAMINRFVDLIVAGGGKDVSHALSKKERLVSINGARYLLPTVLLVNPDNPMFGTELPFPFLTVTEVPDRKTLLSLARDSLNVTSISRDETLFSEFVNNPTIKMVYSGLKFSTCDVNIDDPFDGFIGHYLYNEKNIRL